MPIKKIDLIEDAHKYKEEMMKDLKRDVPAAQRFVFFKGYKGPKDKNPRNILLLGPLESSVVSEIKASVGVRQDSIGTFTTNSEHKLVFDPADKAKSIAKTLAAIGFPKRVQLAPGETEDESPEGEDDEGASKAPTATAPTPPPVTPPSARPPVAPTTPPPAPVAPSGARPPSTPPPAPPTASKPPVAPVAPTAPGASTRPATPPPPVPGAKPPLAATAPVAPGTRPPVTPPPPAPKPPGAPVAPSAAQPPATPPPAPPVVGGKPPVPTFKPGTPPPAPGAPKPPGAPVAPGAPGAPGASTRPATPPPVAPGVNPPAPPSTPPPATPPVTPAAPAAPVTAAPGIEAECKAKLAAVGALVAEAATLAAVPPAHKAALEARRKQLEGFYTAKRYTEAMEGLVELEKTATSVIAKAYAPVTEKGVSLEAACKKLVAEVVETLESVTSQPAVPAETKTSLAAKYKKAVAFRDAKQFSEAMVDLAKVRDEALESLSLIYKPQTKEEAEAKPKLTAVEEKKAQAVADSLVNSQIETESIVAATNLPELDALMAEHRAYVPREMKAFNGYRGLDDVLAVKDVKKRSAVLKGMNDAFATASARQLAFYAALKKAKDPKAPEVLEAGKIAAAMLSHIPDAWMAERATLGKRLDTLAADPVEKKKRLDEAMKFKNPDPAMQAELDSETGAIMAAVEQGSLKSGERARFYFDAPVRSITPAQSQAMQKAYDKIVARAYEIRDCGGSVKDAEEALAHIPPDYWPPAMIETLQAWRKVEREMADERVSAAFAKKPAFKIGPSTVKESLELVAGLFEGLETLKSIGDDAKIVGSGVTAVVGSGKVSGGITSATGVVQKATDPIGQIKDIISNKAVQDGISAFILVADADSQLGAELAGMLEQGEVDQMSDEQLEQVKTWLDRVEQGGNVVKAAINGVASMKDLPGLEATSFALHVCPILSIAANGIDIGLTMKKLAVETQRRVQAGRMKGKAELRYYSGEDWDGGALVDAVRNERDARSRNITRVTIDAAGKSVALAGDITLVAAAASPGGQAAGVVLKVVGKGVQVGNKMVFTGVDWGIAEKAKKLMAEARAGNPIARQQIFADSALYAKMYICILAREDHPLAKQFLVQRGYEEKDIMKPSISLKIMRDALLKDSSQEDETQVSGSFMGNMADKFAKTPKKVVVGGGKAVASGAKKGAKAVTDKVKGRGTAYDPAWRGPTTAALDEPTWRKVKDGAIAAGLYDQKTGIGEALKKVADASAKIIGGSKDAAERNEKIFALIDQLAAAADVVGQARPKANDEATDHAGMIEYLGLLRSALLTEANLTRETLKKSKVIDTDWKPIAGGFASTSWKKNWEAAVKACRLDPDDGGTFKAFTNFEAASAALAATAAKNDKMKTRDAAAKARDALAPVAAGLAACWQKGGEFAGLRKYVDGLLDEVTLQSKKIDTSLFGGDWTGPKPATPPAFSSAEWVSVYGYAQTEGYTKASGSDVTAALKAVEAGDVELAAMADSPAKLKKRKAQVALVAKAVKAIEALGKKTPETHPVFDTFLSGLRDQGHARVVKLNEEGNDVAFGVFNSLVPSAWERTYDLAVAAGALEATEKNKKAMTEALKKIESQLKKIEAGKTAAAKFAAFLDLSKLMAAAAEVIETFEGLPGGDNAVFGKYLHRQGELIRDLDKHPAVEPIIKGTALTDLPTKPAFAWTDSDWQKVKKAGVTGGLFPDSKTGIGAGIDDAQKAFAGFEKIKAKPKELKNARAAALDTMGKLAVLRRMVLTQLDRAKVIQKPNLIGYFEAARTETDARLTALTDWTKANPEPAAP